MIVRTNFPRRLSFAPVGQFGISRYELSSGKPGVTGRKIFFGGESGVVLGSLSANVIAPGFEFSAYAYTPFFTEIAKANLLEFDGLSDPDFARVLEYIRGRLSDYFRFRLAEKSGELIQDLKDAGVYPYEGDPRDEVEKQERQVFDIATHAVASYSRDFKKADNPLKKITLGLLREAVSHNPESVSRILRAVFNLPKVRQDEFSQLLDRTELGNIISASTLIADRIVALKVLSEIVFEPGHRQSVKERGELDVLKQRITQDNRPTGLMLDKPNYKVWVKSWAEIIRDCDSRLKFVQDTLRIEVSTDEIRSRIADLKSSVMRIENIKEDTIDGPATNSPAAAKPKKVASQQRCSQPGNLVVTAEWILSR